MLGTLWHPQFRGRPPDRTERCDRNVAAAGDGGRTFPQSTRSGLGDRTRHSWHTAIQAPSRLHGDAITV